MISNPVVVINRSVKRVTIQRTILSLVVWNRKELQEEHIHVLFQNQLWLEQKCLSDKAFSRQFEADIVKISKALKSTNFKAGIDSVAIKRLRTRLKQSQLDHFFYPTRHLPGLVLRLEQAYEIQKYKESGVPTSSIPEKRWMGIGPRDNGTQRNPAIDGSPSWQEVGSIASNLERQYDELVESLQGALKNENSKIPGIIEELSEVYRRYQALREDPRAGIDHATDAVTDSTEACSSKLTEREDLHEILLREVPELRMYCAMAFLD